MSILTREDLEARITSGALSFDPPLDEFQLQGHTIDLRIGFSGGLDGAHQTLRRPTADVTLGLFHEPRLHAQLFGDLRR